MERWFGSLLVVVATLLGCMKIEVPVFKEIRDFHIRSVSLGEVRLSFGMAYINPNNFSVSVKETEAKVYLDSIYIGQFRQDSLINVKDNSVFVVPLSGTIPLSSFLGMNVKELLKSQVQVRADGSTKVGKGGVYITKKIIYQGRHRLDGTVIP